MEAKDIISYLGFKEDQFKTIDEFKEAYNKDYVKRSIAEKDDEIVSKVMGRVTGSIVTALKKSSKALEIEIDKEVFESKKVEDVISIFGEQAGKKLEVLKTEYEGKLKGTESDAVKDWTSKYEKLESKYKDTDGLVKTMKEQLGQKDTEFKTKIKEFKIGDVKKSAIGSVKFASTVDDLKKKGFMMTLEEKYELDIDEQENVYPKDRKTGQRIPNPAKNGEFFSYIDVVQKDAEENKLTVQNNANQNNFNNFVANNNQGADNKFKAAESVNLRNIPFSQR